MQLAVAKNSPSVIVHLLPNVHDMNRSAPLLPLLLYLYYVILRHILEKAHTILDHLDDVSAHVALNDDLVEALRVLRDGGACREFLCEELRGFFQVDICAYAISELV